MAIRDLITPQFIKDTYILGIDLTLDNGDPFPDIIFEQAIDGAISHLELELGVTFDEFVVKGERHDARVEHKHAFWPFQLDHRPVQKVENIAITLGTWDPVVMPIEWATITSAPHGQINLIPTAGTVGSFYFRSGVPLIFGDVFSPYSYVPAYFAVDYTSGFKFLDGVATIPQGESSVTVPFSLESVKPTVTVTTTDAQGGVGARVRQVGTESFTISVTTPPNTGDMTISYSAHSVDPALIRAVGLIAAMTPLDIAGDLIAGAGIANYTVGVDGLHQTIATTASASFAGYGARIHSYQKQLKDTMSALRAKYRMMNMFSV